MSNEYKLDMKVEMKRIGEQISNAIPNILKISIHADKHKFKITCHVCMDYVNMCNAISKTKNKLEELK